LPTQRITAANAAHLGEWARLAKGVIRAFTFSPDGKILAVGTSRGIYFYDPATGEASRIFGMNSSVMSISFSPGGKLLTVAEVKTLAALPPLPVVRSRLVGMLKAPATKVAGTIAAPARNVVGVFKAYAQKAAAA
jgi:hypothetical protein